MATDEKVVEGARGFGALLHQVDDGCAHAELSEELQRLGGTLNAQAIQYGAKSKGTLTLTLTLTAEANGTVNVDYDVKVKTPKPKRPRSVFWLTRGNNLTPENPKQQRLPLREVPVQGPARDVPTEPREVRG